MTLPGPYIPKASGGVMAVVGNEASCERGPASQGDTTAKGADRRDHLEDSMTALTEGERVLPCPMCRQPMEFDNGADEWLNVPASHFCGKCGTIVPETARAAHPVPSQGVKLLDWQETYVDRGDGSKEVNGWEADSGFGSWYEILMYFGSDSYGWQVRFDCDVIADHDDPERAKAAAQEHFASRVRAAIAKAEATPSDAAEREELATWFEDEILGQVDLVGTGSEPGDEYRVKFNQKATRIAHLLRNQSPAVGENLTFRKEHYGATVATLIDSEDVVVEISERSDGYELIVHNREGERDTFRDCSAVLKPKHWAALGELAHRLTTEQRGNG